MVYQYLVLTKKDLIVGLILNKYLEGKKPKELTKTKEGLHLLRTLLDRIEYGNFA